MTKDYPRTLRLVAVAAAAWLLLAPLGCGDDDGGSNQNQPPDWTVGTMLRWQGRGVLAEVEAPYGPVKVIRVQGTHREMGYQYGYLLKDEILSLWEDVFMPYLAAELGMDEELAADLFMGLLDQAWGYMRPNTPQRFLDELEGIVEGAAAAGAEDATHVGEIVIGVLMLADISQASEIGDDLAAMTQFFNHGYSEGYAEYFGLAARDGDRELQERRMALEGRYVPAAFWDDLARLSPLRTCSFFSVWGDRTDGRQLSSRLLDWSQDIGLAGYRLLTVFVPDEGAAHVTIGYVGFVGALAGISERGVALGHVGASNTLERLRAEPGTLKSREILQFVEAPEDAVDYLTNQVGDGINRPCTIGANAMVVWGDPDGGGAGAEGVASETTGIFASAFRSGTYPACEQSAYLYEFAQDGALAHAWNHVDDPDVVNQEADASEIDRDGNVRTFQVDESQQFVYDATSGLLIDDPQGLPYPTGRPLPCAFYRGDEALAHGVRRYQLAANGPRRDSENTLMHLSGSYRNRYLVQHDMIDAYYRGVAYVRDAETIIPDHGGVQVVIGPEEAKDIAQQAAMDSNVFAVIYDTTHLIIHVAYESGTGATWTRAVDNAYWEVSLADLLFGR